MTPKNLRTLFICQTCGFQTGKWLGRCPECEAWNSFQEEVQTPEPAYPRAPGPAGTGGQPALPLISLSSLPEDRRPCGYLEFDRALGGGLVLGSVVLLGGEPGIGKSTLMLQVLDRLCGRDGTGLYVSGEESAAQLKLRANRLGLASPTLLVATETCLENIFKLVDKTKPHYLALDSIQTLYAASLPATPGSITQVRETAFQLVQLAKRTNIPIFLIGHVTKEGAIAGPKLLEHMVDTVPVLRGGPFPHLPPVAHRQKPFRPQPGVGRL